MTMHPSWNFRCNVKEILIGAMLAGTVQAACAQEISAPEKLLFQTNHFANVTKPMRLSYVYRQVAAAPEAFSDNVSVDVIKRNADGTASVAAQFLTGVHAIAIPPIDDAHGNPVLLGFLERDIAEMKRLTGGATGYFRKRIRLALATTTLAVQPVAVSYLGKAVSAQQVVIYPYRDDPLKDRFGKFADKGYIFILSNEVPGSLYRIYTTLNAAQAGEAGETIDASLTLAGNGAGGNRQSALDAQSR